MKIMGVILLVFLFSNLAHPFVYTKTNKGETIKWPDSTNNIPIHYYNNSSNDIINSNFNTIFNVSLSEWNNSSRLNIYNADVESSPSLNNKKNDIYFDYNNEIFTGTGVAAVTEVVYEQSSGKIVEADIVINDNVSISIFEDSKQYLGNILSHEVGHLLGLGHSQVYRSTMFYKLFNGQYKVKSDDLMGVKNLYSSTSTGKIKGRIIGSFELIGIFGAHVMLISSKNGKVVNGIYTDEKGEFSISGLDLNDQYYIYVEPAKNLNVMPPYLSSVRNDFCSARARYRGNFYNSCYSSEEGYPIGVKLDSDKSSIDIGDISISCELRVNSDYFLRKEGGELDLDVEDVKGNIGNAIVGYFSNSDLDYVDDDEDRYSDHYRIDLSQTIINSSDLYLEVRLLSQSLYSPLKYNLKVEYPDLTNESISSGSNVFNLQKAEDGSPSLEITHRIPLFIGKSLQNNFKLSVRPIKFDANLFLGLTEEDFFPDVTNYGDNLNFYFMIVQLVKKVGDDFENVSMKDYGFLTDNRSCPDAPLSYSVPSNIQRSLTTSTTRLKEDDQGPLPVGCGSINGNPPSTKGPFNSFLVGLFLSVILLGRKTSLTIHR